MALDMPDLSPLIVRDQIYISEGDVQRVVAMSVNIPSTMARTGPWHVEDFDLHKELYRGKTSLLYHATDKRSGLPIALKLYRKRKLSQLNRYQVEREIRIHIKLDHENIIMLWAAFEDEKNVYLVQEFAGGGDLFEDMKKGGGQMKEKQAAREVLYPFMCALAYLHSMGIIHRDIKPENILLTSARVIKVADFGLSIDVTQERPVTRAGTLDYMAPEVLVCPDKRRPEENKEKILLAYTAQVDAWAVGILAYELMVGYPPFEQESRAATYEFIMYKDPKFPAWMTQDAKKFIAVALCKNATQRLNVVDLAQQPWIQLHLGKTADQLLKAGLAQYAPSSRRPTAAASAAQQHTQAPPSPTSPQRSSASATSGRAAALQLTAAATANRDAGPPSPTSTRLHQKAASPSISPGNSPLPLNSARSASQRTTSQKALAIWDLAHPTDPASAARAAAAAAGTFVPGGLDPPDHVIARLDAAALSRLLSPPPSLSVLDHDSYIDPLSSDAHSPPDAAHPGPSPPTQGTTPPSPKGRTPITPKHRLSALIPTPGLTSPPGAMSPTGGGSNASASPTGGAPGASATSGGGALTALPRLLSMTPQRGPPQSLVVAVGDGYGGGGAPSPAGSAASPSGTYLKPQGGVLSDDCVPAPRSASYSAMGMVARSQSFARLQSLARPIFGAPEQQQQQQQREGGWVGDVNSGNDIEYDAGGGGGGGNSPYASSAAAAASAAASKNAGSKYSKLFAKMWGGKDTSQDSGTGGTGGTNNKGLHVAASGGSLTRGGGGRDDMHALALSPSGSSFTARGCLASGGGSGAGSRAAAAYGGGGGGGSSALHHGGAGLAAALSHGHRTGSSGNIAGQAGGASSSSPDSSSFGGGSVSELAPASRMYSESMLARPIGFMGGSRGLNTMASMNGGSHKKPGGALVRQSSVQSPAAGVRGGWLPEDPAD